jgi:hypothetical protein
MESNICRLNRHEGFDVAILKLEHPYGQFPDEQSHDQTKC